MAGLDNRKTKASKKQRNGAYWSEVGCLLERNAFTTFGKRSGLLTEQLSLKTFEEPFSIHNNRIELLNSNKVEQLAQLIARFLREQLLIQQRRFSFETVFSHPSNLDIMKRAVAMGYSKRRETKSGRKLIWKRYIGLKRF